MRDMLIAVFCSQQILLPRRYEIRDISPPAGVRAAMELQAEAERRKRAQILESEGTSQAKINVAEAKKQEQILGAEALQTEVVLVAEARKKEIVLAAEGWLASSRESQWLQNATKGRHLH